MYKRSEMYKNIEIARSQKLRAGTVSWDAVSSCVCVGGGGHWILLVWH